MIKNNFMSKVTGIALFIIMFMIACISVYASGNYIDSTISISHNSTLTGKINDYSYNNHKISITPSKLEYGIKKGYTDKTRLDITLKRPLYRLGIRYGTETKFTGYQDYYIENIEVTTLCGNAGKGKRYYTFSTWTGNNQGTGSLAGKVRMESYQ